MPREFPLRRKEQNSCHQNRRIKKERCDETSHAGPRVLDHDDESTYSLTLQFSSKKSAALGIPANR